MLDVGRRSALLHVLTKKKGVKICDVEAAAYPLLGMDAAEGEQQGEQGREEERPKKTKKEKVAAADEERPKKKKKAAKE
jgi:hypothetical protein